jgi:hypothetical protein
VTDASPPAQSSAWIQAAGVAGAVVLVSFTACWWLALPSFTIRDSALFAMVAQSGGIAHPPGSPTWCLLATLFVNLLGFNDPARGTNLFCGLLGSLTLGGLYLLSWRTLPLVLPAIGCRARLVAALVAPLILARSPGWWMQCLTTEQYTLMTAFLVLLGHLVLDFRAALEHPRRLAALALALGVTWGLATGNHLSQICLVIPAVAICWFGLQRWRSTLLAGAGIAVGFAIGISIYLWVPLRSIHDPLIDTGNIESLGELGWLIGREQFDRRSVFEAPRGFVWEWMRSYDLAGEIGLLGLLAVLIGAGVLVRRRPMLLVLVLLFVLPYAGGILYGHLRQKGFGLHYVTAYGVVDWHVAIYLWLAYLGGFGGAFVGQLLHGRFGSVALRAWLLALGVILTTEGAIAAVGESRYQSTGMGNYTAALLDPLPADAVVIVSTDNIAFVVGYDWWLNRRRPDLTVTWGAPAFSWRMGMFLADWPERHEVIRRDYFRTVLHDKRLNPFRVPLPAVEDATRRPIVSDFVQQAAGAARYLIPRGFLFEVSTTEVSNEQVIAADTEWRAQRNLPEPNATRLFQERRAWSELWERRGIYFLARRQFALAIESYQTAVAWFPEEARLWYRLGECHDWAGQPELAERHYRRALSLQPNEPEVRSRLALHVANSGDLAGAIAMLEYELTLIPGDATTLRLLEQMRADLANR